MVFDTVAGVFDLSSAHFLLELVGDYIVAGLVFGYCGFGLSDCHVSHVDIFDHFCSHFLYTFIRLMAFW